MIHCPRCYRLLEDGDQSCARCGWTASLGAVDALPAPVPGRGEDPSSDRERGIWVWVARTKGALIAAFVLVLIGALGRFLVVQNRAAQASWVVQSQLFGWKEDRRSALRDALEELELLHGELLDAENWRQDPEAVHAWRLRWRQRLNRVKATYQLTGQARFGDLNVRTEEALHNLVLYLSSLERGLQERTPDQTSALEHSIRKAFREAQESLR